MKKIIGVLNTKKASNILNITIYSLFFAIVAILGYNCYRLNIKSSRIPQTIYKEYNTVTYVEKPVKEVVYKTKTVYKDKTCVTYDKNDDGSVIVNIK